MMESALIVILGGTGTGKTKLAIELAHKIKENHCKTCEVINADVLQCYRGSPIATNKVTPEEQNGIPHHLIGFADPQHDMNVNQYKVKAEEVLKKLWAKGVIPIVVGGSDYYIKALVGRQFNLSQGPDGQSEVDPKSQECLKGLDNQKMYEMLREVDPLSASRLHVNNTRRIKRYLEIYRSTGIQASEVFKQQHVDMKEHGCLAYDSFFILLDAKEEAFYNHLKHRVQEMLRRGLLDELKELYSSCQNREHGIMQAIGIKDFQAYFDYQWTIPLHQRSEREDSQVSSLLREAVESMKQETFRLAKKQGRRMLRWLSDNYLDYCSIDVTPVFESKYLGKSNKDYEHVWKEKVVAEALSAVDNFWKTEIEDKSAQHTISSYEDLELKWRAYQCNICGGKNLHGVLEWETHCKSRRHRKRKVNLKKKLGANSIIVEEYNKDTNTLILSMRPKPL